MSAFTILDPTPTPSPTPSITPTITLTPSPTLTLGYKPDFYYSTSFNELIVSNSGFTYTIDQFGTNNPTLTCFRDTNYDFVISGLGSHPFALRNNLNVTTPVSGTYNNDTINGGSSGRILFTPTNSTPNQIYYQCTIHSTMSGIIIIKDY
jgi:hypothetical protein